MHPDGVTAKWLGNVLSVPVDTVRWEPIGTGQVGDSVRFHFASEEAKRTLAGKFPAADTASRNTAAMLGLYRKEVEFYRSAAALLEVRVPQISSPTSMRLAAISSCYLKTSARQGRATRSAVAA